MAVPGPNTRQRPAKSRGGIFPQPLCAWGLVMAFGFCAVVVDGRLPRLDPFLCPNLSTEAFSFAALKMQTESTTSKASHFSA